MNEHLSEETIERLSTHQLKGKERLAALAHLGECEICRRRVKSPTKKEFLDRLLAEEKYKEIIEDESISAQSKPPAEKITQNTSPGKSLRDRLKGYFSKRICLFFAGLIILSS